MLLVPQKHLVRSRLVFTNTILKLVKNMHTTRI